MAKKQEKEKVLERTYNVPLRKGTRRAPNWKRTKKAVSVLREFLAKHMKSDNVKLSKELNEKLWEHGIKNPPHHVKVNATKDDKGVVKVELFGQQEKSKKPAKESKGKETKKAPEPIAKKDTVRLIFYLNRLLAIASNSAATVLTTLLLRSSIRLFSESEAFSSPPTNFFSKLSIVFCAFFKTTCISI